MIENKLNIFVCGRFHYHKYVKFLEQRDILNKIYFSYKVKDTLGLIKTTYVNYFLKEYLLYAHIKLIGNLSLNYMMPIYHKFWYIPILLKLDVSKFNLFLAHGNCLEVMRACKRKGGFVIAEVVNAHPEVQNAMLKIEHEKHGISFNTRNYLDARIINEVNFADLVLAPSSAVAASYYKHGIDKNKVIVLNYGAFPNEGKLLSINSLRVRKQGQKLIKILCVAKITPRKGQIYLLNAVGLLREKYQNNLTIELTFVGIPDQDYFNVLSESEVEFIHIQHINNSDMSEFMSNFDLFVLPSIEDGFAVVISEALSIGLPVITTSTTGAADIVQQINPALVIPPADSQALADAILNVIDNKINYNSVYLAGWADYAVQVYDAIVSNLKVKVTS